MLSEEERREMREMAQSEAIREEFCRLKAASRLDPTQPVDLDQLLDFLTTMSRLSAQPLPQRPFVAYSRVLL